MGSLAEYQSNLDLAFKKYAEGRMAVYIDGKGRNHLGLIVEYLGKSIAKIRISNYATYNDHDVTAPKGTTKNTWHFGNALEVYR